MIKILDRKGTVGCQKKDRAIIVKPRIQRAEYEAASLKHLSEIVFQGSTSSMVTRLLDENELSEDELRAIKKMLDQRLRS